MGVAAAAACARVRATRRRESTLCAMILVEPPLPQPGVALGSPLAAPTRSPPRWPRRGRAARRTRGARWSAGCCTRCALASTSPASAATGRASASRRRCRSRSGWCSRSTRSKAACCRCRGAPRARGAAARRRCCWRCAVPRRAAPQPASPWAAAALVLGIASYGLFGAAVLHAWLLDPRRTADAPPVARPGHARALPLLRLERLTFRFVDGRLRACCRPRARCSARALRAARWRWDHKTVFSMLGLARVRRAADRPRALRLARPHGRRAGSTPARRCCCWPTSARASCSKCVLGRRATEVLHEDSCSWSLVVLVVLWLLLGRSRKRAAAQPPQRSDRRADASRCAHCGVHLPTSEAVAPMAGVYCSDAHRLPAARSRLATRADDRRRTPQRRAPSGAAAIAGADRAGHAPPRRVVVRRARRRGDTEFHADARAMRTPRLGTRPSATRHAAPREARRVARSHARRCDASTARYVAARAVLGCCWRWP